ncbi:FTR1 family protein [Cupriavidus taiwanensis]|uniref:Iron permease FTR1 n=1 Tax=Cupriavidus taiwanensis TaxID=164546 RepID=A0A7Z7JFR7_9BURK|nr:FTR1 family protein [Cupriavidus taiwanensis]SOZ17545.1 Iron permease FTR1 [Cupriavidus taiwanensis]SOZ96254.1 Iron permease FTR1 [Cupriavidus taiwanensis]SPC25780.1 Iron permease FTR1 [Cupriavidus taiwanensis]
MFSMLMVTFREGVEAFLIAAVTLTFLQKTGRLHLVSAAKTGILAALLLSAVLGLVLHRLGGMSPFAEAWLALLAGTLVVSCTWHMLKHGKAIAGEIRNRLAKVPDKKTAGPWLAVFAFMLLMVGREGVEAATMIASLSAGAATGHLALGGALGLICAGALAWAWTQYGRRVNLSLFFQVTAIFMVLFSVQLAIYSVHEFSEAGVLPFVDNVYWHEMTEPFGPEGVYGIWLSYGLVLVPLAFLVAARLNGRKPLVPPEKG